MIQGNKKNKVNPTWPDDLALVKQAQQGNRDAFTALYERHLPSVYNRVRYVVPEHDVEDVTQEIFIAVMNSLNSFKGKARFSTWLRTLTNRRIADYYRKRGREQAHIDPDTIESNPSLSTDIHGSTGTSSLDDKILLQTALRRLPDNYQEVLLLRFAEGLKFSEIAQERGQSLEATKSLFRRAIAALREEV